MSKQIKDYFPFILVILFFNFTLPLSYYYSQMTLGLGLLAIIFCAWIGFKTSFFISAFLAYFFSRGIYLVYYHPTEYFQKFGFEINQYLALNVAQTLLAMLLISAVIACRLSLLRGILSSIAIVSSCLIIGRNFFSNNPAGIMSNTSMDPTLIGVIYPVIRMYSPAHLRNKPIWQWFAVAIPVVAIILAKGSVGIGTLCVSLVCLGAFRKELGIYLVIALTVFLSGYLYFGEALFSDSHRFNIYKMISEWWLQNANIWIGTGPGTGWVLIPYIQRLNGLQGQGEYFTWLHSDWIELIFELGIIGLILTLCVFISMIICCAKKKEYHLLSCCISYAAAMIFNMPNRWFISALVGVILVRLVYGSTDRKENDRLAAGINP